MVASALRLRYASAKLSSRRGLTQVLDVMGKFKWLLVVIITSTALARPLFGADHPLEFTPVNGFGGESEGKGSLKLFLNKARAFHVASRGSPQSDGTFRLDQTITFEGQAPQQRFWILTTTSNNRYSATLSDAAGPVKGVTSGTRLSLEYRVKGPLVMHQELELSADGKTINNVGVITLLGIPVGRLHETITRKVPGITSDYSYKPSQLRSFSFAPALRYRKDFATARSA